MALVSCTKPNPVEILAAPASFKADWDRNLSFSVSAHGLLRFVYLPSACQYIYNTILPRILYFANLVLDDGTKTLSSNIQLHSCVCVVGFLRRAYLEFSLDNTSCEKWPVSFFPVTFMNLRTLEQIFTSQPFSFFVIVSACLEVAV